MSLSEIPLFIGFGTAAFHVLTGPDHLAAVTPLVLERRRRFTAVGLLWGVGHLLGMLLIGVLYVMFQAYIPIEAISEHSEQLVGVVLIFLGISALYRALRERRHHVHPHVHETKEGAYVHVHQHEHGKGKPHAWSHSHQHDKPRRQSEWAALAIGVLHGFAGIAHFVLLLPALGFVSMGASATYMLGFAWGVVAAMALYAFALGKTTQGLSYVRGNQVQRYLRMWGGALAILVGVYWLF